MPKKSKRDRKTKREVDAIVGNNVFKLRDAKGLTQEQLADRIGVSRISVLQVEAGTQGLTLTSAIKYAKALGVEINDIKVLFDGLK